VFSRNPNCRRKSVKLRKPRLHLITNIPAGVVIAAPFHFIHTRGQCEMRAFIAACIAICILWAVDGEFNDGRYGNVVKGAFKSILAPR
jgi:hypothetical protein